MRIPTSLLWVCLAATLVIASTTAQSHDDDDAPRGTPPEKLGHVDFPVSCNDAAQKEFNRGMALFHSFWFEPSKKAFAKVLEHDPGCGMAQWGIAFMSMGNPFAWPANPAAMKAASTAAGEAKRISAKSARERDYIEAMGIYFEGWETVDHPTRAGAWEKAMASVARRYPEDIEARIIHALLLDATASPADKTFAKQLQAAEILEPLFLKYPDHPGVPHYLIHTYDYAELAHKGLPAARIYAGIAPSVPHALHMPSHIFSRVGQWEDLISGNIASYNAAMGELSQTSLGIGAYDALHAMDYMVFGYLQLAQDKAARRVADEVASIRTVNVENFVAAYAFASIPSRIALEHGDWRGAASLELSPSALAWNRFPQAEAILVFARGLGAARSGDPAAARRDAQRLQALRETMIAAKNNYWAGQASFQIKTVNAWIAFAEQRNDEALQLMRAAATEEEASDKHPVTPGNVVPSRELLGDMLMLIGRPSEALTEYEQSLKRDPNRFRAIYGAGRAAEASGQVDTARKHYANLKSLAAKRDNDRPELTHADLYLASN